jgi:hypothetical protein
MDVDFFVLTRDYETWVLTMCMPCVVTDCGLSFEGSCFTRFERTSCFQNVVDGIPDCTVLLPRNSKPNLQIYIAESKNIHYAILYPAT